MANTSLTRIVLFLALLLLLGGACYLVYYFVGKASLDEFLGDFGGVLGNFSGKDMGNIWDTDPFLSDNSTKSWPTNGVGGLQLTIVRAFDEAWDTEFTNAVSDWDNGNPDALTLNIQYDGEADHDCTPIDGLMKVCNGNWGETGWLGTNDIISTSSDGIIQNSVVKMNEYYLQNAEYALRQYTMCHEIGHGFGLPHTDESFTNKDIGNCLDYTKHPAANMHPDVTNFRRLVSLYGTVGQNRNLLVRHRQRHEKLSPELREAYETAIRELEHGMKPHEQENLDFSPSGWRKLREHSLGADFVRKLNDDYTLEVHMLYAQANN